jgi:N-acetylneuraminic acid mutarotase
LVLALAGIAASAQSNEWAWMSGQFTVESFGVYGTLGTPAPGNAPGSRYHPVAWAGSNGDLWLFGGSGMDATGNPGYLNDLWKYSAASNEWTWVSGADSIPIATGIAPGQTGTLGTPAPGNLPEGRIGAMGWTDAKGNLWLFGGESYSNTGISSSWNDLWMFNPATNEWTWESGSATANQFGVYGVLGASAAGNVPGSRADSVGWTDSKGNLWLFGGTGYVTTGAAPGTLSDLWKFDPATSQWTWISGSNQTGQPSVPGTLRTPAAGNAPGARQSPMSWTDNKGNFWLFGGAALNDLWEYAPSTNQWAWMGGNTTFGAMNVGWPGVYGQFQTPAAANQPGSRVGAYSWTDRKGNLWMFGGVGYDADDVQALLDDLWEYDPIINEWAWMGGSAENSIFCPTLANWCGRLGVYGTLQVPSLATIPGSRYYGAGVTDSNGNFWLFGGVGIDAIGISGLLNDLWEYQPNTSGMTPAATPLISPGTGTYTSWQTVAITDSTPGATIQYLVNGGASALNYSGPLTINSSEAIEAIASAPGYANSNIASASFTVNLTPAATPVFSLAPGTYAIGQTVKITDSTPGATIYYAIGSAPTTPSTIYTGPISVSTPETIQALAVADGYAVSAVASAAYNIGANPTAEWTWLGGNNNAAFNYQCPPNRTCGLSGWYGTLGMPAASNYPGARFDAVTWTDATGNLWLFGGDGFDATGVIGDLNDLWVFNPTTSRWTWVGGSNTVRCLPSNFCGTAASYGTLGTPADGNIPGGREGAVGWTDAQGNFWLFGGYGTDSAGTFGPLNDLWKLDPATRQWAWMGGSSSLPSYGGGQASQFGILATPAAGNQPGGRREAVGWVDKNGHFWLYGGLGEDARSISCHLDDLWEYDPGQLQWAWMNGNKSCPNVNPDSGWDSIYGFLGTPMAGATPGSLESPSSWTDPAGNLWLFGGTNWPAVAVGGLLNDVWQFYPALDQWAWMNANAATNGGNSLGVYGTRGSWNANNVPGVRERAQSWTDAEGNFWMFGGLGYDSFTFPQLNDLWEYKTALNEWAWMGGPTNNIPIGVFCSAGVYNSFGASASTNVPGGRMQSATWTDKNGNLWLFGGSGCANDGTQGYLNDLWEFNLSGASPVAPPTPTPAPIFSPPAGSYTKAQSVSLSDQTAGAVIHYTIDGTRPNSTSAVYSTPITVSTTETVNAIAVANGMAISAPATAAYALNFGVAAQPAFSIPGGTYTSAQTVAITDSTPGAVIYYTTDGSTTPTAASTRYTAPIVVSTTETLQAIAIAANYSNSPVASATYTISIPPPSFTLTASPSSLNLTSGGQGTVTLTVTPQNGFNSQVAFNCSGLAPGAGCSFSPTTVTPSGAAVTTILTITAETLAAATPHRSQPFPTWSVLAFAVCIFGFRKRRRLPGLLLLAAVCAALGMLSACGGGGGGGNGSGRSPVTSTITIYGSAGAVQESVTLTLTVN